MHPNITKIIDQYLSGELSAKDKSAFEERLNNTPELQAEVELQKSISEGAARASQRTNVQRIGKRYHFTKFLKWAGISLAVIAAAITSYILLTTPSAVSPISQELIDEMDKTAQIEELQAQYFQIPEEGSVVISEGGVLLSVPADAFLLDGQIYTGKSIVQLQEATNGSDIVKSGLSTVSGDQLLETQGMFGVQGFTEDGKPLDFNPKVGVYVQVPVDGYKQGMQLYDGKKLADGSINWQDPEPLEKLPVPINMSELDFYPVEYEAHLDEIKWKQDKKSRDSLYLSFEDYGNEIYYTRGKYLFESKCATCHLVNGDATGPSLMAVRYRWAEGGALPESVYDWVNNWEETASKDPYAANVVGYTSTSHTNFPDLSKEAIDRIYDYIDSENMDVVASPCDQNIESQYFEEGEELSYYPVLSDLPLEDTIPEDAVSEAACEAIVNSDCFEHISPSKVLAFWNSKFNNTNLSTREFERRMRIIHETCNDLVLEKYTQNLDKSISEIDKEVVALGYREFQKFASENVGALNPNNPHIKHLQEFYQNGIDKLKKNSYNAQKAERDRQAKQDTAISNERRKERKRSIERENQAFDEEYNYNLDNVYKQLGYTKGFTIRGGSGNVSAPTVALKNIDALVREATAARKSTTITDPVTDRRAQLTYNAFSFTVENHKKLQQVVCLYLSS